MKKTLIALMALAGVACAFDNVELSFEGSLGNGFTWTNLGQNTNSPTYADSGLVGYGQAIVFDKTGFISSAGDYSSIVPAGDKESSFSVVTTVKFDTWSEYTTGGTENRIYIFGSGDKWDGMGWSIDKIGETNVGGMAVTNKGKEHNPVEDKGYGSLELDTWYTLALTYNAADNKATFYVNGTSVGSVTVSNTNYNAPGSNGSSVGAGLGIGNAGQAYISGPWAGQMADFKLFNSTLTADQVAAYGAPVTIPEPATATLSLLALAGLCARRRRA